MNFSRANEHCPYRAAGTLVKHGVDVLRNVFWLAPCLAIILAVHDGNSLVLFSCSSGERDIASTTQKKDSGAVTVSHHTGITKACVEHVKASAFSFHNGEWGFPCMSVVLTDTCSEVYASIASSRKTDVHSTIAIVGHGNQIAIGCSGNGRDTVGNVGFKSGREDFVFLHCLLCLRKMY